MLYKTKSESGKTKNFSFFYDTAPYDTSRKNISYPKALNSMLTHNGVKFFLRQHLIFDIATILKKEFSDFLFVRSFRKSVNAS